MKKIKPERKSSVDQAFAEAILRLAQKPQRKPKTTKGSRTENESLKIDKIEPDGCALSFEDQSMVKCLDATHEGGFQQPQENHEDIIDEVVIGDDGDDAPRQDPLRVASDLIHEAQFKNANLEVIEGKLHFKAVHSRLESDIRRHEKDIIWLLNEREHEALYVTCKKCSHYNQDHTCQAAGNDLHHAARGYKIRYPERPMRCYAYKPSRNATDKRTGDERWPWMRALFSVASTNMKIN